MVLKGQLQQTEDGRQVVICEDNGVILRFYQSARKIGVAVDQIIRILDDISGLTASPDSLCPDVRQCDDNQPQGAADSQPAPKVTRRRSAKNGTTPEVAPEVAPEVVVESAPTPDPVVETDPTPAPTPAPAPAPTPAPAAAAAAATGEKVSIEQVRAAVKRLVLVDEQAVGSILAKYGAQNISQLNENIYGQVIADVSAALA